MGKKIILFIGCGIFTFHLLATVMYIAPTNPMTNSYRDKLRLYMDPLFTQAWGLFAPTPATNFLQLRYRCGNGAWFDPITPLYRAHHAFPFTYRAKLIYIYEGLVRDLFNVSIKENKNWKVSEDLNELKMDSKIARDPKFTALSAAVRDLCRVGPGSAQTYEFQISRIYARDYSKRLSETPLRQDVLFFPKVEMNHDQGASYASH